MIPLPQPDVLEVRRGFVVATGPDCSAPLIRGGVRQDVLLKTGHWQHFARDYALAAEFGIRAEHQGRVLLAA